MDSSPISTQPDMSGQNLTIEEAVEIFNRAGVPRSARTVSRYCEQNILEAVLIDTEKNQKYLVSRASVERRIKEIKQVLEAAQNQPQPHQDTSRHDQTRPDMTRHNETSQDTSRQHEQAADGEQMIELKAAVKKLKAENLQLSIDRSAKEQVIATLVDERERVMDQAIQLSREVGRLESQLLQLEAPRVVVMSGHDKTHQNSEETPDRKSEGLRNTIDVEEMHDIPNNP